MTDGHFYDIGWLESEQKKIRAFIDSIKDGQDPAYDKIDLYHASSYERQLAFYIDIYYKCQQD